MKLPVLLVFALMAGMVTKAQETPKRLIQPNDVNLMKQVRQPKVSPDGQWILYTVSQVDSIKDKNTGKLYMVSWDGKETVCLTAQTTNPGAHAWSPDGKYISFLAAAKGDEDKSRQLFLMDRRGGEPVQLTHFKGDIASYNWSGDGKRIVFVIGDPDLSDTAKSKVRKPYEITKYQFKQDYEGYLDSRKSHLYLFDLASKKTDTLTRGEHEETGAVFSHDGQSIAYVSNISANPDRNSNTDIFVLDLNTRKSKQVTTFKGSNGSPQFSPDDTHLAYSQTLTEDNFNMYDVNELVVRNLATGKEENLSKSLDRSVEGFVWSTDGKSVYALVEDDRKQHLYQLGVGNGSKKPVTSGNSVFASLHANAAGKMVAMFSDPQTPDEVYAFDALQPRRVTHEHDAFLSIVKPVYVKGFQSTSADKTLVSGILYLPDSSARNLPLVLFIHGGPVAQDDYSFDQSRQVLAAAGFAVAAVNYRGSSGRGAAFARAIYADWGNKEVMDIVGAANHLIKSGVADSNRLAIGGWSYGGILTNYTIAKDKRFKAAVSGAGSSLQTTMYGTDQYVKQYDEELGAPWKNPKKWMELSYPFFNASSIKTPTLFMASQNDFNVPVAGAEQMYQALKHEGVPTGLVIYPGQNHGVSVPSYIIHRYWQHIAWYKKHLK